MIRIIKNRSSGVLLPIFSLPGPWGIGDLGSGADSFIDFLSASGQAYWQILPLSPVSPVFGNSPYTSFSALAGNPLFISPELLQEEGILQHSDMPVPAAPFSEYRVEYDRVTAWKQQVLALAWQRFQADNRKDELTEFMQQSPWVADHGLFLALKKKFGNRAWWNWPEGYRRRTPESIGRAAKELAHLIEYSCFEQYIFSKQWNRLHDHTQKKGIRLIGDLPIYVGMDSVDVWANQKIFQLSARTCLPTHIAGVPPDYFSRTGQRWGNPLYRWNSQDSRVKKQLYNWWQKRLQSIFSQVDLIRIDHFRGFEAYWSIPAKEKTAINGTWINGPGEAFFRDMERRLGNLPVIAEDLGIITEKVHKLRDDLGYPGMKILLFAFDGNPDNSYLPYNVEQNSVIYTGTHDNDTAVGWYLNPDISLASRRQAKRFANRYNDEASSFHLDMIYLALSSPAVLSILPMQDVLGFGNDCRINTPGTTHGNWQWRCAARFMNDHAAQQLRESTMVFGRLVPPQNSADRYETTT